MYKVKSLNTHYYINDIKHYIPNYEWTYITDYYFNISNDLKKILDNLTYSHFECPNEPTGPTVNDPGSCLGGDLKSDGSVLMSKNYSPSGTESREIANVGYVNKSINASGNISAGDLEKISKIDISGEGNKYLSNDGNYKEISSQDTYFITTEPINNPIGSFYSNQEINENNKITLTNAINMLLHKYIAPAVNISVNNNLYEIGQTANLNITIKVNKGSENIQSIKLYNGTTLINTFNNVTNGGTFTYKYSITKNSTIKVIVSDNQSNTNATSTITFVNNSYYGIISGNTVDETIISGLTSNLNSKKAFTYNNITLNNERIVYLYPASFGNLTSIKDANGFEYLNSYVKSTITIDSVSYNCYMLENPTTISGFKQIFA